MPSKHYSWLSVDNISGVPLFKVYSIYYYYLHHLKSPSQYWHPVYFISVFPLSKISSYCFSELMSAYLEIKFCTKCWCFLFSSLSFSLYVYMNFAVLLILHYDNFSWNVNVTWSLVFWKFLACFQLLRYLFFSSVSSSLDTNEGTGWNGEGQCKAVNCGWRRDNGALQEEWGIL